MASQSTWRKENEGTCGESHLSPTQQTSRSAVAICARTFRTLYLLLALLYTFWHIVTSRIPWKLDHLESHSASSSSFLPKANHVPGSAHFPADEPHVLAWTEWGRLHGVEWDKDMMTWSIRGPKSSKESLGQFNTTEDLFLSKAFGESLQPSKVIPYYYRATSNIPKQDITITTLVTSDRFQVLAALVKKYQGETRLPECQNNF